MFSTELQYAFDKSTTYIPIPEPVAIYYQTIANRHRAALGTAIYSYGNRELRHHENARHCWVRCHPLSLTRTGLLNTCTFPVLFVEFGEYTVVGVKHSI